MKHVLHFSLFQKITSERNVKHKLFVLNNTERCGVGTHRGDVPPISQWWGPQSRCCLRSICRGMPIPTHRWVTFITNCSNSSSYFRSVALAVESRGWVSPFAASSRGWFSVTSSVESPSAAASPFLSSRQRGSLCWGTWVSARQFSRESSDLPAAYIRIISRVCI